MRWLSRLVTGAVIVAVVGAGVLLLRSQLPKTTVGEDFTSYALFRDGSRFAVGSPVVIAGVRVGDISRLSIEGDFARVDLRLRRGLQIPVDSFVTRRSDSLFGDNYVEIMLGGGDEGAANIRFLRSGEPLTHVIEGSSTDAVLRGIARTMPKIDNALGVVHDVMSNGRRWVNGPVIERLQGVESWLGQGNIEGPITKADNAMIRVDEATERGAAAVHDAVPSIASRLASFDKAITAARTSMRDVRTGIVNGLHDAREGFDRIDKPVHDMSEVMVAINEGKGEDWKGTLGRLVNDHEVVDTIEDVTEAGAEGAAGLNRFRSWLGVRFEVNLHGTPRVYATAELQARNDKFYLVEFERSGLGSFPADSLSDAANTSSFTRRQEIHDKLRFTAQFGKRLGMFAFRGGVKESTVGVGIDALMLDGRLQLSTDVFGSFVRTPRVKIVGAVAVFRSVYVLAGVDDVLNPPGSLPIVTGNTAVPRRLQELRWGRDYFVGATLHFTDQDLTTLLRVYGALLASSFL